MRTYILCFLIFSCRLDIMSDDNRGRNTKGGDLSMRDVAFTLKVMQQQFERFGREMTNMRGDLEEVRHSQNTVGTQPRQRGNRQQPHEDEYAGDDVGDDGAYDMRDRPRREERMDSNINSIKMKIPSFKRRNDAETFMEWERKVERIFECHNYSEIKKVKLAVVEFIDYALVWWDQLLISRRRNGEGPIQTWVEMRAVMRRRFVPSFYYRELHQKLQRLT